MDKNSNSYTVGFAVVVCVVLAIGLASTYAILKGRIEDNARFDKQKNVLIAMGLHDPADASKDRAALEGIFNERVKASVMEVVRAEVSVNVRRAGQDGTEKVERVVELRETEHDLASFAREMKAEASKPKAERKYVPLYRAMDEQGIVSAWCIPIEGYGLWSTLYGFLALEGDLNKVKGITFYKHGETPGLGGEVENLNWQKMWRGKTILDAQGKLVSVTVKKGIVDQKLNDEVQHYVDGLSGATITCNGVTKFLLEDLEIYEPYFKTQRKT